MTTNHAHTNETPFVLTPRRIESLQDGVFAIVMTLLVLEMHLPDAQTHAEMRQELLNTLPIFLTYILTFVNLGIYWVGQQIQFHSIERSDRLFAWIHVVFLMFVSLLPFSSSFLGRYPNDQTAAVVYGVNMVAVGLMSYIGWVYASHHHRLTSHDISEKLIESVKTRLLVAPVFALLAIGLSFFHLRLSELCYLLVLPYYIIPGHIDKFWQQKAKPHQH